MLLKFYKFTLFALIASCVSIRAEYLVFKKQSDGALAVLDDEAEHAKIYSTLMRYQFPANTNPEDPMPEEERLQSLENEQKFLQTKLDELGLYQVVFIPTTLYELYILDWYLDYRNRAVLLLDWFFESVINHVKSRDLLSKNREEIGPDSFKFTSEELMSFEKGIEKHTGKFRDREHARAIKVFLCEQQKLAVTDFNRVVLKFVKDFVGTEEEFKTELACVLEGREKMFEKDLVGEKTWIDAYLANFCRDPFTFDGEYSPIEEGRPEVGLQLIFSAQLYKSAGSCRFIDLTHVLLQQMAAHLQHAHFIINKLMGQRVLESCAKPIDDERCLAPRLAYRWLDSIMRNFADASNNPKKRLLDCFYRTWSVSERTIERSKLNRYEKIYKSIMPLQLLIDKLFGEDRGMGHHALKHIIELEYVMHARQQALVFRGSSVFDVASNKYFILPYYASNGSIGDSMMQLSFGASLCGGIFKDIQCGKLGANAIQYMAQKQLAYVVRIGKKDFVQSLRTGEHLFCIPPYTELTTLLMGRGEYFHVRTTTRGPRCSSLSKKEFLRRFGDFFAENTFFVRSVEPINRARGEFHDDMLEKELIENTRNIGKMLAENFSAKVFGASLH